jgi:glycine/D-amino acid oxidase-like deaminating enzyme
LATHSVIVGAGLFGLTSALELRKRGHRVSVLDAGQIPAEDAASNDISKVVRCEYGHDELLMDLMTTAFEGWKQWNEEWQELGLGKLYHETGLLVLSEDPMAESSFALESFIQLQRRGFDVQRLGPSLSLDRFPSWQKCYRDGFFNPSGGYVESARVIKALAQKAQSQGIGIHPGCAVQSLKIENDQAVGVTLKGGRELLADQVVVATGAWTQKLIPELQTTLRSSGHSVFHFKPDEPELFTFERFPVFFADIQKTAIYGFPLHPLEKVVKIAMHDENQSVGDPCGPRQARQEDEDYVRAFIKDKLPDLATAPIVGRRLCFYSDGVKGDNDFWICRHPVIQGLTVAAGGNGHAFKFAPVLGGLIADAVEAVKNSLLDRFRWSLEKRSEFCEQARFTRDA